MTKKLSINKVLMSGFIMTLIISVMGIATVFASTDLFKLEDTKIKEKSQTVEADINSFNENSINSKVLPDAYHKNEYVVSDSTSDIPIYMWYDEDTGETKWYSNSTVAYLNPDSSSMFE